MAELSGPWSKRVNPAWFVRTLLLSSSYEEGKALQGSPICRVLLSSWQSRQRAYWCRFHAEIHEGCESWSSSCFQNQNQETSLTSSDWDSFNAGGSGSTSSWGAKIPHASWPQHQNIKQKQYCNKSNKVFKINMVHIKNNQNHGQTVRSSCAKEGLVTWLDSMQSEEAAHVHFTNNCWPLTPMHLPHTRQWNYKGFVLDPKRLTASN